MNDASIVDVDTDLLLANRLRDLRTERGWSLDELARRSGASRATLSRIENGDVSPTASVLGRLCAAYGLTMSRLMHLVEDAFPAVVRASAQPVWIDPETGFHRRVVSPPAKGLSGEALDCELPAGTVITYDAPPRPGLEHHLVLREGRLRITLDDMIHDLGPGDCLRYQLFGGSSFTTPEETGARYLLFMV